MNTWRLALIQAPPAARVEENRERAVAYIRQASESGASLTLFPELWSHGYLPPYPEAFDRPWDERFTRERERWLASALRMDDLYLRTLRREAADRKIAVVATGLFRGKRAPRNTALLISAAGEVLLRYDKVHTCAFSMEGWLEAGTSFPVAEVDGIAIGLMICYDREFPESARLLMLGGAELILVPNACSMNPARLGQLSCRAFENMTGVAMANYAGSGWGRSCAFTPTVFDGQGRWQDNTLAMAGEDEAVLTVDWDLPALREYRARETWGNAYRRPDAYAPLLSAEVRPPFLRPEERIIAAENWMKEEHTGENGRI